MLFLSTLLLLLVFLSILWLPLNCSLHEKVVSLSGFINYHGFKKLIHALDSQLWLQNQISFLSCGPMHSTPYLTTTCECPSDTYRPTCAKLNFSSFHICSFSGLLCVRELHDHSLICLSQSVIITSLSPQAPIHPTLKPFCCKRTLSSFPIPSAVHYPSRGNY